MNFSLFYIGEVNAMPAKDMRTVEEFIAGQPYGVLATSSITGKARVSGLSQFPGASLQEICFATDSNSEKVKNIRENPICELLYTRGVGSGQVILTGEMNVLTDPETKRSKWNDEMIYHFPDGPDGTCCILIFKPIAVRVMLM